MTNNYAAVIAKLDRVVPIDGADKIQVGFVSGNPVIISKDLKEGDIGVFFPVDSKLSEEYCKTNSLFRECRKNLDETKTGFFDINCRVRAQPFMGVKSCGYFAPPKSLDYTGDFALELGSSFTELNGKPICDKYVSPATQKAINERKSKAKVKFHKSAPFFNQHVDTAQFQANTHKLQKGDVVTISAKRHGTSARYGLTKLSLDIPKWQQLVNKIVTIFPTTQWEYLVGTRRVNLFPNEYQKEGFHGKEQYRYDVLNELKPFLEKGMTIYGEICGYANDKLIMGSHSTKSLRDKKIKKKYGEKVEYTYGCEFGQHLFQIYRITNINESGKEIDFTPHQVEAWCEQHGFKAPLQVYPQFIYNGDKDAVVELVERLTEREEFLSEDFIDPSHVSEGIVVRIDNGSLTPTFLKSKSFIFKVMEGIAKEKDDFVDEEDSS